MISLGLAFSRSWGKMLLKTLWEKERTIVTTIFSFSHKAFCLFKYLSNIFFEFCHLKMVLDLTCLNIFVWQRVKQKFRYITCDILYSGYVIEIIQTVLFTENFFIWRLIFSEYPKTYCTESVCNNTVYSLLSDLYLCLWHKTISLSRSITSWIF